MSYRSANRTNWQRDSEDYEIFYRLFTGCPYLPGLAQRPPQGATRPLDLRTPATPSTLLSLHSRILFVV